MKIYGRKILDYINQIDLDNVDHVVFDFGKNRQIVVNLYCARTHGDIEISTDGGLIYVQPRASNVVNVKMEKK